MMSGSRFSTQALSVIRRRSQFALLRVLGLHRTLWVLPTFVFLGAAGVALGGGLIAALLLKGADGTFRNSLHRFGLHFDTG